MTLIASPRGEPSSARRSSPSHASRAPSLALLSVTNCAGRRDKGQRRVPSTEGAGTAIESSRTIEGPEARSSSQICGMVVRLAGLEPATLGLEGRCSIHLSYRRVLRLSLLTEGVATAADETVPAIVPVSFRGTSWRSPGS